MTTIKPRPMAYHFLSWHEFGNTQFSCQVPALLDRLTALGDGTLPVALETEPLVRAFADGTGIRVADPDVEPHLTFPNLKYASRDWVRAEYKKFLGFCRASGWLDGGPETLDAATPIKRGPGRPRKQPAPA